MLAPGHSPDLLGVGGCEAGEDVLSHVLCGLVWMADAACQLWQGYQPDIQGQLLYQSLHHCLHIRLDSPLLTETRLLIHSSMNAQLMLVQARNFFHGMQLGQVREANDPCLL